MIIHLVVKEALLQAVEQYIDECGGVLDGETDTKHVLDLIDNAPVKSTWIVKE